MTLSKNIVLFVAIFTLSSTTIFSQNNLKEELKVTNKTHRYGIEGQQAPELDVNIWIDENGKKSAPIKLADHKGKFKVIYGFQAWCPGCHSRGLPSLKKMSDALADNDNVEFFAIQTVFEGKKANTFERMAEIQKEYDLKIPFGHDTGEGSGKDYSTTMQNYRTGGTPWFILIDENDTVVFNDYHLDVDNAIKYLKNIQ